MSPRVRKAALVLAPAVAASIVGASVLVGGLGGDWRVFLTLAVLMGVTGFAAWVLLWSWNAQKRPVRPRAPRSRWREREGHRDGYVSDGDGEGRVWDPDVTEVLERHVDRDRWAS